MLNVFSKIVYICFAMIIFSFVIGAILCLILQNEMFIVYATIVIYILLVIIMILDFIYSWYWE